MHVSFNEKRGHELESEQRRVMEDLEVERKGRNVVILIQSQKQK